MSVVIRTMQGRQYIHVRRKVNGTQLQKFIHIDKMSDKDVSIEIKNAQELDNAWKLSQNCNDESIMSFFCREGKLKHILISPPQKRTDWSVKSIINAKNKNVLSVSRSIPKHGFDKAVKEVVERLFDFFGIPKESTSRIVIMALYRNALNEELREKYSAKRRTLHFQSQLTKEDLEFEN